MMRPTFVLAAALGLLVACSPPPIRRQHAPPSPPSPAKHYTMICKNSQTGARAVCGTRDAVMVGLKED